jgi:hypothetical protein
VDSRLRAMKMVCAPRMAFPVPSAREMVLAMASIAAVGAMTAVVGWSRPEAKRLPEKHGRAVVLEVVKTIRSNAGPRQENKRRQC